MQPTLPPGPRWPALVQTVQYATHTREHLLGLHARYGDFFTIHALNGPVALACTPALAKEVFTADAEHYSAFAVQATRSVLGSRSVLVTHGAAEFHAAHLRHLPVGDHQPAPLVVDEVEGLAPVARRHYLVARGLQSVLEHHPDHLVVVNDQDSHGVTPRGGLPRRRARTRHAG